MPNIDDLRKWILEESRGSRYSIHSGSTNMHHEHREVFWWEGLKKDVTKFVAKRSNANK